MEHERRLGDYHTQGWKGKVKRFFDHPLILGMTGALVVAAITWASGILSSIPANYVPKVEFRECVNKTDNELKRLDEKKLDTSYYLREHTALREEMLTNFKIMRDADSRIEDKLDRIWISQQQQYKKQNKIMVN